MKYLYTGVGILLGCLILCLTVTGALDRALAQTASELEQARLLGEAGELGQAAQWVDRAAAGWEGRKGFLGIVLRHDELDKAVGAFRKLRICAANGDAEEFVPECAELIETLGQVAEREKPYYYNVL